MYHCKVNKKMRNCNNRIILGLPWLHETNPIIDWRKGTLEWREQEKQRRSPVTISEEDDKEEYLNSTQNPLDESDLATLIRYSMSLSNSQVSVSRLVGILTGVHTHESGSLVGMDLGVGFGNTSTCSSTHTLLDAAMYISTLTLTLLLTTY